MAEDGDGLFERAGNLDAWIFFAAVTVFHFALRNV